MEQFAMQRTLASAVSFSGTGVHSGVNINLTIKPAPANHGIKFVRTDLPDTPAISAIFNMVVDTSLATVIGHEGAIVSTIEHLMACFTGLGVDNALVELDGYEMPIMDGSAREYTEKIIAAGIVELDNPKMFFIVKKEISIEEGDKKVVATPSDSFSITCTIDFNHPLINRQSVSFDMGNNNFAETIGSARTFGFYRDIEQLKRYGLARGATLETGIALEEEGILNEEGLRFKDEFARHKLLDCLGDFSLLGMPILGHIETFKSGHAFNHEFLKKFFEKKDCWETGTKINA